MLSIPVLQTAALMPWWAPRSWCEAAAPIVSLGFLSGGFSPISAEKADALVLGFMPSVHDLAFWSVVLAAAACLMFAGSVIAVRTVGARRGEVERSREPEPSPLTAERARIARDMHDELGASVTRIKLLSELIERNANSPDTAMGHARRISRIAAELSQAMDEIVWAVNPEKDRLENLVHYLGAFTEELLGATHLSYRLDFPEHLPDLHLPAQVRHQLFLAAKEALNNAVKHSHATSVGLRLSLTNDCVEICVQDNGIGFDPAATQTQRNGLRNLCQRLESVGGSCGVTSNPGAGTSVRLAVPLSAWACGGHHPCAT